MSTPRDFYISNRTKLIEKAKKDGIQTLVVPGNSLVQSSTDRTYKFEQEGNFFYLTGLQEPGAILAIIDGQEYISVPERSQTRIEFEGAVDTAKMSEISGVENICTEKELWEMLKNSNYKQAGVLKTNPAYLPEVGMYTNPVRSRINGLLEEYEYTLNDIRSYLSQMRTVKKDYEIEITMQAIKHTEALLEIIYNSAQTAKNESDLMADAVHFAAKHQLDFAYDSIIASGKNACTLHYIENNSAIQKNEMLLLDIGLKYKGYSADITRTISIGKQSERQKQIYNSVAEVQDYAISLLKPGVLIKEYEEKVLNKMREKLKELGLINDDSKESIRKYYPHSTSHYLGIDVHDPGDYTRPLEPGVLLTVEPGIYVPDEKIGVRIEEDVLITEEGCEVLTTKLL